MTNEEKRIKLAEYAGWTGPFGKGWAEGVEYEGGNLYGFIGTDPDEERGVVPDYFNYRDASISMIANLSRQASSDFAGILMDRTGHWPCGVVPDYHSDRQSVTGIVCSSAKDLANSLGIALGLWTAED
jgi:hypothetical protein